MSHNYRSVTFLLGLIVTAPLYGQKKADRSPLVIVGDSLSAGYQNSQLVASGQPHGSATVIATQAGVDLQLPIIPSPGYPQVSAVPPSSAFVVGVTPQPRLNTDQTLDVAVPGFTVANLVGLPSSCPSNPPPYPADPIQVMAAEILNPSCSNPGPTELAKAAALKPTTAILWVGSNDVLFSLLFNSTDPTDIGTFYTQHSLATTTLAHASKSLVLANIPDVTLTAYLTSVPKLAAILNLPVDKVEKKLGLHLGDMVTPYAFPLIQAMGRSLTALPDSDSQGPVVIRAATLATIRAAVVAYNLEIAQIG